MAPNLSLRGAEDGSTGGSQCLGIGINEVRGSGHAKPRVRPAEGLQLFAGEGGNTEKSRAGFRRGAEECRDVEELECSHNFGQSTLRQLAGSVRTESEGRGEVHFRSSGSMRASGLNPPVWENAGDHQHLKEGPNIDLAAFLTMLISSI